MTGILLGAVTRGVLGIGIKSYVDFKEDYRFRTKV